MTACSASLILMLCCARPTDCISILDGSKVAGRVGYIVNYLASLLAQTLAVMSYFRSPHRAVPASLPSTSSVVMLCFRPTTREPGPEFLQLVSERNLYEAQSKRLKQQLEASEHAVQAGQLALGKSTQQSAVLEGALIEKTEALANALRCCSSIAEAFKSKRALATRQEGPVSQAASQPGSQTGDSRQLDSDCKQLTVEGRLASCLEHLEQQGVGLLNEVDQLLAQAVSDAAAQASLQARLSEAVSQHVADEAKAKAQMDVLELRCAAMEASTHSLQELNKGLEEQLVKLQQSSSEASEARKASAETTRTLRQQASMSFPACSSQRCRLNHRVEAALTRAEAAEAELRSTHALLNASNTVAAHAEAQLKATSLELQLAQAAVQATKETVDRQAADAAAAAELTAQLSQQLAAAQEAATAAAAAHATAQLAHVEVLEAKAVLEQQQTGLLVQIEGLEQRLEASKAALQQASSAVTAAEDARQAMDVELARTRALLADTQAELAAAQLEAGRSAAACQQLLVQAGHAAAARSSAEQAVTDLSRQLEETRNNLAASKQDLAQLACHRPVGQALGQALAAGHLQGQQPLQQPVGRHYPVCVFGGLQAAAVLAVLQRAAASQSAELEAATRRLADARQGAQEAEARAQQAEEERASSLASAAQSQAQVLALRRELAASGQQLAELAKEQARALQNLGGSDEALASATAQLQALRTQHQAAQQEVQQLHVRLGHLDTSCSTAQATVTALSHQLACLQADASSKRAVLAAIAQLGSLTATADGTRPGSKEGVLDAARPRPSSTQPGLAQQHASTHQGSSNGLANGTGSGPGQDSGSDARQVPTGAVALALAGAGVRDSCVGSVAVSYYRVATTEAVMALKVGDLPLHVLGPLACGVADSATLLQLTLDLELAAGQAGGVAGEEVSTYGLTLAEEDQASTPQHQASTPQRQMALRCAVLAAGASLNTSLQQLSLTGFSWGGEGSGLAAPFLALGVPLAPPLAADTLAGPMAAHARDLFSPAMSTYSGTPGKAAEAAAKAQSVADGSSWGGSTSDLVAAAARLSSLGAAAGVGRVPGPHSWLSLRPPALTCVQVDTRLVGTRCADSLAQLLLNGVVTLKKPRGQGLLRLYTDHEVMDEWYGELIQHAHDFPLSNLPPALLPSSKRISSSCGTSKLTEAGLQQLAQQHQSSQGGSRAGSQQLRHLAGNLYPRTTDSSSVTDSTYALGQAIPPSCLSAADGEATRSSALPPSRLPSHQPFPGMGDSTEPAQELSGHVAPIDCDLSNEGIESHHMCMVMAVLISCPHLRRLKLNGNSVGGAGVEIHMTHIRDAGVGVLARGLLHNSSLQELGLARNFVTKEGARKLARALEANSSLRRLDLAGQRCPGALGPGGVEALAAALRNNTTLQELDIGGNDIRTQGAAALGSMLRAASSRGGALRRLSLCDNGLEASVLRVLQTAASEYK
ncbi:hypothetical protein QJQ45_018802, partial [Haematococcus lacustris]